MVSVDTNVIISALSLKDTNHEAARRLLSKYSAEPFVISPVVYAELMASPGREGIRAFLDRADIPILQEMPLSVWEQAGTAFALYAVQRRNGRLPRRIIADFVIAAHAVYHNLKMLTFDTTVYETVFPTLVVLDIKV